MALRPTRTGNRAAETLSRSTLSIARPKADETCSRFAMRLMSVERLCPAPWNTAGLKNAASPFGERELDEVLVEVGGELRASPR